VRCRQLALVSCVGFVLLLTPTGRLPSPRWRWWARVTAAAAALGVLAVVTDPRPLYPAHPAVGNPMAVPAVDALFLPCLLVTLLGLVAGAGSLLGRFRRARSTERLQLRWLALAAAVSAATLLLALATVFLGGTATLFEAAFGVSVGVLPLATGAAILRYRLYDIDRIISRTVAYGLLTVLLAGGYAAVVFGLGQLLGRDSSLVVAAATLAVAAVSSRPAVASSGWWTGASTAAATTPPRRSRHSAPASATRSPWTPSPPSCWPWSTRPCSPPARGCGCDPEPRPAQPARRRPTSATAA
jgi:hypothetical protein